MKVYKIWDERIDETKHSAQEINAFIRDYYEKEKNAYEKILGDKLNRVSGTVTEVGKLLGLDAYEVAAFADGINTSLNTPVDYENFEEDTQFELDIDWEKLYYNMRAAKAPWLYELPQWADILSDEKRMEILKKYKADNTAVSTKVGRNEPCPCGSGKKYKNCCGK